MAENAFKNVLQSTDNFLEATKNYPFEIFLSSIAILVETRCAEKGLDCVHETERMLESMKEINAMLGPINGKN